MDLGYRLLAAKYIRRHAKQLAEQFDGVRAAEDIEFVHRARVATRRLRAALRMFDGCFSKRRIRRWQNAIRRTTAKLGDARDRDVQIELLCGTLSALGAKECFPGLSRILVQLERQRERLQRKVVAAVDRLEAQGVLRKMRRAAQRMVRRAKSAEPGVYTSDTLAQIGPHIREQIDELLRHQDSLGDPDDRLRHHAMRIAAKRLRYTLEVVRPAHAGKLEEAVGAIKRVQSLLGDVHDCDVWAEHLDAFAAKQRKRILKLFGHAGRFVHLQPGIEYLRQDRRRHRQEAFEQLVEYWGRLNAQRFWEGLAAAVSPVDAAAAQPAPCCEDSDAEAAAPAEQLAGDRSDGHQTLLTAAAR